MVVLKPKGASGVVDSSRSVFVVASLFLTPACLTSGKAVAQLAGDKFIFGLEPVAEEEVAHWSKLPLWGEKEARKYGFELPLPLGVSGNLYSGREKFDIPQVKLGWQGGGLLDLGGLIQVTDVKVEQTAPTSRFDAWVLPFLDLYAVAGYVDGQADVEIRPAVLPILRPCSPKFDIRLEYEGPTLGLGGTLAGGFKPVKDRPTIVFGLADLNFTKTFLDFKDLVASLDTVDVMVYSMRLGVRERILQHPSLGDLHISLWGGAMYQGVQEVMTGRLEILDLNFRANVEAINPWNTIVGGRLEIGKNINMTVEVGIGERESLMLEASYRF